jgi:hypothetical protein
MYKQQSDVNDLNKNFTTKTGVKHVNTTCISYDTAGVHGTKAQNIMRSKLNFFLQTNYFYLFQNADYSQTCIKRSSSGQKKVTF